MSDSPTIRETPVSTVRLSLICPECGQEMQASGLVMRSYPYQEDYVCPCGFVHRVCGESYPRIEYRNIVEPTDE